MISNNKDQSAITYKLLNTYNDVQSIIKDSKQLFSTNKSYFLLIADKKQAIMVEIGGKEGQYEILSSTDNDDVLFHTNHFVLPSMWSINQWNAIGSDKRFQRIRQLIKDTPRP